MIPNQHRRGWVLIAAIAIGIALLCLLAAPAHSGHGAEFAAILPLLLVGLVSPLSLFAPLAFAYAGRRPAAPALAARFQRPPPFPIA
jgi:hypothetical protein